jgi:hypothetical protein
VACQTATYFSSETAKNDKLAYRLIVWSLFFLDLLQSAMCCHTLYTWTVSFWGNPAGLVKMPWTFYVEPSVVGAVTLICQAFCKSLASHESHSAQSICHLANTRSRLDRRVPSLHRQRSPLPDPYHHPRTQLALDE